MAQRDLYITATNCTGIRSVTIEESYSNITASAVIECSSSTLVMGDLVTINMGYVADHAIMFKGYVKKIEKQRPENVIRITANDLLIRAVDYFLAADNPKQPYQFNNISSLDLITELLALAGITNVTTTEPTPVFTWGTNADGARFNLQSVAEACQFVAGISGNTIYYDIAGDKVEFTNRKPYATDSDTPLGTWNTGNSGYITGITYEQSTDKTRNRVRVYGRGNITALAEASNSYLVVDQTLVIGHEMLDTQAIADGTAEVNLELLNHLGETYTLDLEGIVGLHARQIYTLDESFTGTSNRKIFVYQVSHSLDESGFISHVTAIPKPA